jgi:hypothetical protein
MTEDTQSQYLFAKGLEKFLAEISGLSNSLPIIMDSLNDDLKESAKTIDSFLKEKGTLRKSTDDNVIDDKDVKSYAINVENYYDFSRLVNSLTRLGLLLL